MLLVAFITIVAFIKNTQSFNLIDSFIQKNNVSELIELLIPTIRAPNSQCRADSQFYLEELLKLKLWATEMFDASSKFPNGILFGSSYNLGNFDECIEVSIPIRNEELKGKYCLAKFHIEPPEIVDGDDIDFYYQYYKTGNFTNVSTWEKILAFSNDRSRCSRADFHLSFCIPSSCDHNDLEISIRDRLKDITNLTQFSIDVQVDKINCYIDEKTFFNSGDIAFIVVISLIVIVVAAATLYDLLIKIDDLKKLKLNGVKHKVLCSFSLYENLKKVSQSGHTKEQEKLAVIHGFKVISMFLVILGHRLMFFIGSPIVNPNYVESMYYRFEAMCLLNGPIIVDTFFVISGFLASYLLITEWEKRKNINIPIIFLHRILRFTITYGIVVAFYSTIFIKLGSGPFWHERVGVEQERCLASWWANLLYINNYINTDKICMFQSWYIACDLHYFLITPFIIWLFRKNSIAGSFILGILIIASVGVVFGVVFVNNEEGILLLYRRFLRDPVTNNNFKNVYIPTHMRAAPYFVGVLSGYLKYRMEKAKFKLSKVWVRFGWIIAALIGCGTVYFPFVFYSSEKNNIYNAYLHATYAAAHHFIFSIVMSWIIIAILEGHGRWIQPLLVLKPLTVLSRLTYTVFLSHGAIQLYSVATLRQPNYVSVFNLVSLTTSDILLSYIAGLVLSMYFEAPLISLEKIFLKRKIKEETNEQLTTKINFHK